MLHSKPSKFAILAASASSTSVVPLVFPKLPKHTLALTAAVCSSVFVSQVAKGSVVFTLDRPILATPVDNNELLRAS